MQQNVPEFRDLLKALNEQGVRFVIVGGFAMILNGGTYVTFDLDLAISPDPSNATAIVRALAHFHPFPPEFGSPESFVWDERSITGSVVSLVTSAGNVDILRVLPEIESFDVLWERSGERMIFDALVRVASIDDLIKMKEAANRPKDLNHIQELRVLKHLLSVEGPKER